MSKAASGFPKCTFNFNFSTSIWLWFLTQVLKMTNYKKFWPMGHAISDPTFQHKPFNYCHWDPNLFADAAQLLTTCPGPSFWVTHCAEKWNDQEQDVNLCPLVLKSKAEQRSFRSQIRLVEKSEFGGQWLALWKKFEHEVSEQIPKANMSWTRFPELCLKICYLECFRRNWTRSWTCDIAPYNWYLKLQIMN